MSMIKIKIPGITVTFKFSLFFFLFSFHSSKWVLADEPSVVIIDTKVICKQPGRYIGWPTITKTRSGELLIVFSGDRDEHVCPWGITQMVRSQDAGKTWSDPITINNTPLDDRDAGILETKSGTLLVSWFTSFAFDKSENFKRHPHWQRHAMKLDSEIRDRWFGSWTRRFVDSGKSWELPVKQHVSAPHGPIELTDGRLLYVGTGLQADQKILGVEESHDDGKTWQFMATINIPSDDSMKYYWEPCAVELTNKKLIAMFRYEPKDRSQCYLRQSESIDGGRTWTMTHQTPIWGYPPHIIQLQNGWLMVSYGVRREPFSERICISRDGGKTWDIQNEIMVSRAINSDLGYPSSVQLDNGSILTVYYQIDKQGEKTCLMGTHWRFVL